MLSNTNSVVIKSAVIVLGLSFILNTTTGQILPRNDNNFMKKQLLCALEKGPCDIIGNQIKKALPEIIGNNCRSCDHRQKANAERVAKFIQTTYPNTWRELVRKYAIVV